MNKLLMLLVLGAPITTTACRKQVAPPSQALVEPAAPYASPEIVEQMTENFARVHFALDSSTLDESSKEALAANVELMQKYSRVRVEIEGHADERGTTDYNLTLGERRANVVRDFMVLTGVSRDRVTTISYGEERPAATGHGETAWSQNRRAEFRILTERPDGASL